MVGTKKRVKITPKQFANRMELIRREYSHDKEAVQSRAVDLLCETLFSLGYLKGLKTYNELPHF